MQSVKQKSNSKGKGTLRFNYNHGEQGLRLTSQVRYPPKYY